LRPVERPVGHPESVDPVADALGVGQFLGSTPLEVVDVRERAVHRLGRDLSGADLSGSNFAGQDLSGATLRVADLTDANLAGAALEEGDAAGEDSPLVSLVQTVVSGAVISLGVLLFVADWSLFWLVFLVGFVAVLPAATKLAERYESRSADGDDEPEDEQAAALATLRERYADGEIDEAAFERRVERLLETESVEDAEDAYGGATTGADLEPASETTSDAESERASADGPEGATDETERAREPE